MAATAQTSDLSETELAMLVEDGVSSANMCSDLERWEQALPRSEEYAKLLLDIKGYQAVCSLPIDDLTKKDAQSALGDEPLAARLEDNVLTLFARGKKDQLYLCCSISSADWTALGQSNLFGTRLRLAEADKVLLKLALFAPAAGELSDFIHIRGKNAPPEPPFMADVKEGTKGQIIETTLASPELGEIRKLTIYLPPGHKADGSSSILVMADGRSTGYYARMIEPMITQGLIRPVAIIGVHSDVSAIIEPDKALTEIDVRALDYLPEWDKVYAPDLMATHPNRFEQHMRFVTDTLLPWVRTEYGLSTNRLDTGVTGQSNGGVFALYAGFRHPDTFGTSIPVSPGWGNYALRNITKTDTNKATFFIAAGLYEPTFLASAQASASSLEAADYEVTTTWNAAGHSPDQTEAMLFKYLPLAFPPTQNLTKP